MGMLYSDQEKQSSVLSFKGRVKTRGEGGLGAIVMLLQQPSLDGSSPEHVHLDYSSLGALVNTYSPLHYRVSPSTLVYRKLTQNYLYG